MKKPDYKLQCAKIRIIGAQLPSDVMSEFDEQLLEVTVNTSHCAYLRTSDNPQARTMYVTGLVGKEILAKAYQNPKELADKVLEFQQDCLGDSGDKNEKTRKN